MRCSWLDQAHALLQTVWTIMQETGGDEGAALPLLLSGLCGCAPLAAAASADAAENEAWREEVMVLEVGGGGAERAGRRGAWEGKGAGSMRAA